MIIPGRNKSTWKYAPYDIPKTPIQLINNERKKIIFDIHDHKQSFSTTMLRKHSVECLKSLQVFAKIIISNVYKVTHRRSMTTKTDGSNTLPIHCILVSLPRQRPVCEVRDFVQAHQDSRTEKCSLLADTQSTRDHHHDVRCVHLDDFHSFPVIDPDWGCCFLEHFHKRTLPSIARTVWKLSPTCCPLYTRRQTDCPRPVSNTARRLWNAGFGFMMSGNTCQT